MSEKIVTRYYQDTRGSSYEANLRYERKNGAGYYSASVRPVQVENCDGYFSIAFAVYDNNAAFSAVSVVGRRSGKTDAAAVDLFTRFVLEYFENRGLVARLCKIAELAR